MIYVDPDAFAMQVNYVATLGRLVVPRAFAFTNSRILFVGYLPFHAEELGSLLPEQVEWHEYQDLPTGFSPDIVVVGREFVKTDVRSALESTERYTKVIPQEGFVDELLFGHDWWNDEVGSLKYMVNHHRGLQVARSLGHFSKIGIPSAQNAQKTPGAVSGKKKSKKPMKIEERRYFSPFGAGEQSRLDNRSSEDSKRMLSWPSSDALETKMPGRLDLDLQPQSSLNQLGYSTSLSRAKRWSILEAAVPKLGISKVAGHIAWLVRWRKKQQDGKRKFANAITEWEYDLARLKQEYYKKRSNFSWPDTGD